MCQKHNRNSKLRKRLSVSTYATSSDNITVLRWRDNRDAQDKARRWDAKAKQYIEITRPYVIKEYNKFMGGVDLMDRMIAHYTRMGSKIRDGTYVFFFICWMWQSSMAGFATARKSAAFLIVSWAKKNVVDRLHRKMRHQHHLQNVLKMFASKVFVKMDSNTGPKSRILQMHLGVVINHVIAKLDLFVAFAKYPCARHVWKISTNNVPVLLYYLIINV